MLYWVDIAEECGSGSLLLSDLDFVLLCAESKGALEAEVESSRGLSDNPSLPMGLSDIITETKWVGFKEEM